MCIVAAKYFPNIGWVGIKNRDRNYRPVIRIRKSTRGGIERLYIWDEKTKYSDGLNEYGVCIISASVLNKKDEKEGHQRTGVSQRDDGSPDGRKLRTALLEKTPEAAMKYLIDNELPGNTLIFNKDKCYLLEAYHEERGRKLYSHKEKLIPKTEIVARTNHGVWLPDSGYLKGGDGDNVKKRKSSENRMAVTLKALKGITNHREMLKAISDTSNSDPQMNPLRCQKETGKTIMKTTGQILLLPHTKFLYYNPIWSGLKFEPEKLKVSNTKTRFSNLIDKNTFTLKEFMKNKIDAPEEFDTIYFKRIHQLFT